LTFDNKNDGKQALQKLTQTAPGDIEKANLLFDICLLFSDLNSGKEALKILKSLSQNETHPEINRKMKILNQIIKNE